MDDLSHPAHRGTPIISKNERCTNQEKYNFIKVPGYVDTQGKTRDR